MRITLRLIISLAVAIFAVASVFAYMNVSQEKERQRKELERRSRLLSESLLETVEPRLAMNAMEELQSLVEKFGNRERLAGMALYDVQGKAFAITSSLIPFLAKAPDTVSAALTKGGASSQFDTIRGKKMYIYALPVRINQQTAGALAIFHDATYIRTQLSLIWRHTFLRILAQVISITVVTLFIVRWSVVNPIAKMAEWMKRLRAGENAETSTLPGADLFSPIAREATTLVGHLSEARALAEEEARLRHTADSLWTPERLKEHIKAKLRNRPLLVISNREPYMHQYAGKTIECIVPAGGLVTALEPVLRACGGTWIAHGAGDADWELVDEKMRLKVPTEEPLYILKRVPLTKEEEKGYYYGFANEGLWPLCHIAHTRPIFGEDEWGHYQKVNQKFAQAALEELEGFEQPCVLIQDYHFALLPRLIKQKLPEARVAIFWHIPWPNPETFGVCPWQRELLYGMLGADLIGFQTQYHCNNFLDTVDHAIESRIDWEHFSVNREGRTTLVKPFPISVAFPHVFQDVASNEDDKADKVAFLKELGVKSKYLGVGVERMDYTKGVLERFMAIERFLDKYPQHQGEFTFVQLGAPSRVHIKRYHDFLGEVDAEAQRINWKFEAKDWKPIIFLKKHHSHQQILPYYRNADLCMVTSLHDGMNLVAKEFVASREDNDGVLILSCFTGASRELRDALIVNPYDIGQMTEAIRYALEMDPEERASRMCKMRQTVREHNIYRWAGNLIEELTKL